MTTTKTKLPKWFEGTRYPNGDIVKNPFSGEEFELTAEELSMYDFIKGSEFMINMNHGHVQTAELIRDFNKAIDWFRETNPKAYMILLD